MLMYETDNIKVEIFANDLHKLITNLKMLQSYIEAKENKIKELEERINELTTTNEKGDN